MLPSGRSVADERVNDSEFAEPPITPIPMPPELDPRRIALGERLFRDVRLSHDDRRSCMSCHDVNTNGASPRARDLTPAGRELVFKTPTIFNAALSFRYQWEGRYRTMEEQASHILSNPDIMAASVPEILDKLRGDRTISKQFLEAYGRPPEGADLLDALVTYERTLLTPDSRFDRWLRGDNSALSKQEIAGYHLFTSMGCVACHQGVNIGGNMFQAHGIFSPLADPSPAIVRVPSLRNIAVTAPYFHDGSSPSLTAALQAMNNAQMGGDMSEDQEQTIVAFLSSLTGRFQGRLVHEP